MVSHFVEASHHLHILYGFELHCKNHSLFSIVLFFVYHLFLASLLLSHISDVSLSFSVKSAFMFTGHLVCSDSTPVQDSFLLKPAAGIVGAILANESSLF